MSKNNLIKCGCTQCLGLNNKNTLGRSGSDSSLSEVAVLPVSNKGFTGSTYLDGILWGGNYWNTGAPKTIDYSFWNDGTESFDDAYGNTATNAYDWFAYEKTAMVNALNTWSAVADIQFVDVGNNNANATLGFYNIDNAQASFLGAFNPPGTNGGGIGYFNWQGTGWDTNGLLQGGFGFITLIHELGHGLGLAHPHDNGGGSSIYPGVTSAFGDTGDYGLNQGVYTTMSYNDGLVYSGFDPGTYNYGYQGAPMAFDIAAIQYLYGANTTYKTGDDTYLIPTVNGSGTYYSCIWDAGGGNDKISGSSATGAVTINLNDATLNAALDGAGAGGYISSATGIYGGFTIANGVIIENADGGGFNDNITGNEANNSLDGNGGNDTIDGGKGNDFIYGDTGSDSLNGGSGDDYVDAWIDNDVVNGGDGNDTLYGYDGNDTLNGEVGNDTLYGEYDNDSLDGGTGNDLLSGDLGDDYLFADTGNDVLNGGDGNDTLDGWTDNDLLNGENGNDSLLGYNGNDTLNGQAGNDSLYGEADNDLLNGGDGNDTLDGGDGQDNLNGNLGNDSLLGGSGNDTLYGLDGNDKVNGELGNDSLIGGVGNDNLLGGGDNDTLNGGVGNDFLNGEVGNDSLIGAGDNDTLYGLDGNDTLDGGLGIDSLIGGVGNDTLLGGDGNDNLNGGAGIDSLLGGINNDTLNGGASNDILTGEAGNDSFTYATGAAFVTGSVGIDTITDFTSGVDKIVLSKTTFTAISSSIGTGFSVASEFATVTTFAQAESSTADIVYNSASDRLFYNQNGAVAGFGTGGAFAAFTNNPTLVASNFSIVA